MSLRGVWVRLRSLAADSPLHAALAASEEEHLTANVRNEVEDALNQFKRG